MVKLIYLLLMLVGVFSFQDEALPSEEELMGLGESVDLEGLQDSDGFLFQKQNLDMMSKGKNKRGIDFGLGRGFSGSQAARHFLGRAAASFAGGPGKRKRVRIHAYPIF